VLKLLRISNIAVVSAVEIEFGPGLNLLTGETGAGKSILVDALGLLLGGRASADMLRTGEASGAVEGVLQTPALSSALEAHGIPQDGEDVIVRRDVSATGKGRASVNGALVPVSLLREILEPRVEIHGQHDHKGLLEPESHVDLLDQHAGVGRLARDVAERHRARVRLLSELEALRKDRRELMRRREMLEFQAKEIEAARLAEGEEQELRAQKAVQANATRLRALAEEAYALLYEQDGAALQGLKQVYRKLEELAGIDARFRAASDAGDGVLAPLDELARELRDYRGTIEASPGRLDEIETRLALLERLKKKYGASVQEVLAFGARCREELEKLESPEAREAQLDGELKTAAEGYKKAAVELSKLRREAGAELAERVLHELKQLALEKARFRMAFDPEPARPDDPETWGERGLERGEFLLSPNPGEELRPLARIASGGELSRILLALESVASRGGDRRTLVFDEVDSGIGGRVAEVVGRRLRTLAARHQVLCVTHLPQVAALADSHFVVRKRVERGRTVTEVEQLDEEARVEELARMLAGETVTESARRHAREMMKQAVRS
jgi:DNA repair protein RecN (Recombination protein N)